MDAFELAPLDREREAQSQAHLEFLRRPSMSCGLYHLPAGGTDPQRPHTEDEVYFVVEGEARIRVGTEDRAVGPGTVVFVPAGSDHRFHEIRRGLSLLVVFAPAEGTSRTSRSPPSRRPGGRAKRSKRAPPRPERP